MEITKSGTYKATGDYDTFTVSGKGSKDVTISGFGVGGKDTLNVSYYNDYQNVYVEGKNLVLPMLDINGKVTKITVENFADANWEDKPISLGAGKNLKHLIFNSSGDNGNDIIFVTKNGISVNGQGGSDEVRIHGANNAYVDFSEYNTYADVSINNGSSNVVVANGAKFLTVRLENSSGNTIIGATSIDSRMSDNNYIEGSNGNDEINIRNGTNNTIMSLDGNDHIYVNANGNEFYGGAGKDLFEIGRFESNGGTDVIYDYEFGTDTLQVKDKSIIASSVISDNDVLLNLKNGGSVKVLNAANGISILDSSTGKTFNPLN